MEKDSGKIFRELKDDVSTYVELKLELLKLSTYERSGQLIAILSYGLILLFLAFFAILFIFLALGFFMGDIFGSMGTGFAFVAVLYLLLIGQFGDLIVTYSIEIPTNLTDKQKELFHEIQSLN